MGIFLRAEFVNGYEWTLEVVYVLHTIIWGRMYWPGHPTVAGISSPQDIAKTSDMFQGVYNVILNVDLSVRLRPHEIYHMPVISFRSWKRSCFAR